VLPAPPAASGCDHALAGALALRFHVGDSAVPATMLRLARAVEELLLPGRPAFTDFALRSITGFRGKSPENALFAEVRPQMAPEQR
jgi:hypothetical protein